MCRNGLGVRSSILLAICVLAIASCSNVNLRSIEEVLNKNTPLDEATVVAGLKDALKVGTGRGVDATSTVDGFLGNALIRIALPEQFDDAAGLLRAAGFGQKVDELEIAMNRAAERASGEARDVFWDAIMRMSVTDAFGILRGEDNAATLYFRDQTEPELRRRFEPIVDEKMEEVGLYRVYEDIAGYYDRLPMVERPALDLKDYVTDNALDGLFTVLAEEEKRIREDPLARSTELLRRVFGSEGK